MLGCSNTVLSQWRHASYYILVIWCELTRKSFSNCYKTGCSAFVADWFTSRVVAICCWIYAKRRWSLAAYCIHFTSDLRGDHKNISNTSCSGHSRSAPGLAMTTECDWARASRKSSTAYCDSRPVVRRAPYVPDAAAKWRRRPLHSARISWSCLQSTALTGPVIRRSGPSAPLAPSLQGMRAERPAPRYYVIDGCVSISRWYPSWYIYTMAL